jgi:hypothetical protein
LKSDHLHLNRPSGQLSPRTYLLSSSSKFAPAPRLCRSSGGSRNIRAKATLTVSPCRLFHLPQPHVCSSFMSNKPFSIRCLVRAQGEGHEERRNPFIYRFYAESSRNLFRIRFYEKHPRVPSHCPPRHLHIRPVRHIARAALSIFIPRVFRVLQIPPRATPLYSHPYKSPGVWPPPNFGLDLRASLRRLPGSFCYSLLAAALSARFILRSSSWLYT